jgi:hypothetical protein
MATKADFTPEEWKLLKSAPVNATTYIITASMSGPVGMVKEFLTMAGSVGDLQKNPDALPLLKELFPADEKSEGEGSGEKKEVSNDPAARAAVLADLKGALAVLDAKAGGDAAAFKQWLYVVTEKVANAAKEGGFLGIGGERVSADEQAAMDEIKALLGV